MWELAIIVMFIGVAAAMIYLATTLVKDHFPIKILLIFFALFQLLIAANSTTAIVEITENKDIEIIDPNLYVRGWINASGEIYELNSSRVCTAENGLCNGTVGGSVDLSNYVNKTDAEQINGIKTFGSDMVTEDIRPNSTLSKDFGSTSRYWLQAFIQQVRFASAVRLYSSGGDLLLDVANGKAFRADTDNVMDLGTAGNRWRNGWFGSHVNASTINGSLNCNYIVGGSDADFCADASGVGGSSKNTTGLYLFNDTATIYFNDTLLNITIDNRDTDTTITRMFLHLGEAGTINSDQYLSGINNAVFAASKGYVMPRDGSITGISTVTDVTTGMGLTVDFIVYKNGATTGFNNRITTLSSATVTDWDTQADGTDTFVAGDLVQVYIAIAGLWGADRIDNSITLVEVTYN